MNKPRSLFAMVAALLLLTACEHQELYVEPVRKNVKVRIEFDWSQDPDADPKVMTVYFYRTGAKTRAATRIFDFKGSQGGVVTLPMGEYAALCHNSEGVNHSYIGTDEHQEFGLRLNDMRSIPDGIPVPGAGEERLAYSPEPMWVASLPTVVIEDPDLRGEQVLRFEMMSVVNEYTFIIHNPVNLTSSHKIVASVSGMAATVHPGQGTTGDETVCHAFSMATAADGSLIGKTLTFGHCSRKPLSSRDDNDEAPHYLNVYATLPDGKQWKYTHDVTAHIHNSPVADCVVELDSIELPPYDPVGGSGGFTPSVGGWQGTQEPLGM